MIRMVGSIFVLLFILEGSFAQVRFGICDVDECSDKFRKELDAIFTKSGDPPSIKAIEKSCPGLWKLTACAEDKLVRCTGEKLENLISSPNDFIVMAASTVLNIRKVLKDICNETSDLYKSYKKHVHCVTNVVRKNDNTCWKEGRHRWTEFLEKEDIHADEKNKKKLRDETDCIEAAYGTSCFAVNLGKECGKKAQKAFIKIGFEGLQIFKTFFCRPSEYSHLRQKFLDSLEENLDIRNTVQRAFEGTGYNDTDTNHDSTIHKSNYVLTVILLSTLLFI